MSDLVIRRLLVDMQQPIARHWCAGDAFRSAFFNALSMSFPVGEQFFIDSVKNGLKAMPESEQEPYKKEVQGFVGQEATHRRLHSLYNEHLTQLGYVNSWEPRIKKNLGMMAQANVRHWLAVTAANEHFTAILAEWLLRNPEVLGTQDERLATLWLWHSAEESEHRSTAFNMYRALNGNEAWRLKWFSRVSAVFLLDVLRQTAANLHKDGALFRLLKPDDPIRRRWEKRRAARLSHPLQSRDSHAGRGDGKRAGRLGLHVGRRGAGCPPDLGRNCLFR